MPSHKSWWIGNSVCLVLLGLPSAAAAEGTPRVLPRVPGAATTTGAEARPLAFHVTFDKSVSDKPFTGRVYVMLWKNEVKEPRGISWFNPEPVFARDVKDWKPSDTLVIGRDALACPKPLSELAAAAYHVQAVMDFDRGDINFSNAEGNGYSQAVRHELKTDETGPVTLVIDQVCKARAFAETERVKLVEVESPLLTKFHGKPTRMRAGVVLPASFQDEPRRRYPVVYEIPGFSGNHFGAFAAARRNATDVAGVEFLYVVLDPNCRLGHHVFADSANNGPRGQALIEELIPHIEKTYRGLGAPAARFVTGHSSGGWSSLWLQVSYPDHFGGVWSTAPDPVDFRDFQRIDLTKRGVNMFKDDDGKPRPLARRGKEPVLFYQPFSDMEVVMGHGGQLASFEAVFSERGADGKPKPLWDRRSGAVDPEVAASWQKYDVRLVLERNWKALGPKLAGKIHVYMGDEDTFYLEGATMLLKESLKRLGSDAVVELFPGKNHGSLMDKALRDRIAREMADHFRQSQGRGD
jgi:S-formylglutathione hydrolase FrmB